MIANVKRNNAIYTKYKQGIKTGVLIKQYGLSRQRLHQIIKQVELLQLKNAKTIAQKEEEIQKIKNEELCGSCYFYDSNGFCNHFDSLDDCADRDSNCKCDIDKYRYKDEGQKPILFNS